MLSEAWPLAAEMRCPCLPMAISPEFIVKAAMTATVGQVMAAYRLRVLRETAR